MTMVQLYQVSLLSQLHRNLLHPVPRYMHIESSHSHPDSLHGYKCLHQNNCLKLERMSRIVSTCT